MASLKRGVRRLAARAGDRRGSVAVVVSILAVALVGMLALALDVSNAVSAHTRLREAADVAALTAVRQAAILTSSNEAADLTPAQTAGRQRFAAQASSTPNVAMNNVNVSVARNGLTITSTVTFNATYTTQVAGILNSLSPSLTSVTSLPLGGQVGAKQQLGAYVDIQVLMDVSNSMAIAASDADAAKIIQLTNDWKVWESPTYYIFQWHDCTFACHATWTQGRKLASVNDYNQTPPAGITDFYELAHYNGVSLRIDTVKQAVGTIIDAMAGANALATATNPAKFRLGFYTFDNDTYQGYALGTPAGAKSVVAATEVNTVSFCCVDYQTDVNVSIPHFSDYVLAAGGSGDGSSQAQSKKFVIIITDGINDRSDPGGPNGRNTATFDPTVCNRLKNAGIGVFVLQAAVASQFPSDLGNPTDAFNSSVTAMKQCASPGLYYLAGNADEIKAATQAIINLALSQPTMITQGATSMVRQ